MIGVYAKSENPRRFAFEFSHQGCSAGLQHLNPLREVERPFQAMPSIASHMIVNVKRTVCVAANFAAVADALVHSPIRSAFSGD
jgi:hypothetical protein